MIYRRVNREIKRMDSTSRSPLFAHFSEIQAGGFKSLSEGQRVQFVVKQGAKDPQAAEIGLVV